HAFSNSEVASVARLVRVTRGDFGRRVWGKESGPQIRAELPKIIPFCEAHGEDAGPILRSHGIDALRNAEAFISFRNTLRAEMTPIDTEHVVGEAVAGAPLWLVLNPTEQARGWVLKSGYNAA